MATFTVSSENLDDRRLVIEHLYLYDKEENNVASADFIGPDWDCWFLWKGNHHHIILDTFDEALAWLREKGKLICNPKIIATAEFEL